MRFAVVGVLAWSMTVVTSHGGVWYLLFIPFAPIGLFELVMSSAILWSWAQERRRVGGL
jgi:hypothetical protein